MHLRHATPPPRPQTGRAVAIKMVNVTDMREGVSTVALREIKFLREIKSPHVVALVEVFEHKNNLALVRSAAPAPPRPCARPACLGAAGAWPQAGTLAEAGRAGRSRGLAAAGRQPAAWRAGKAREWR
jgi:hypothetical protein